MVSKKIMYNYVICATEYDWYQYMYQEILCKDNVKYYKGIDEMLTSTEKKLYATKLPIKKRIFSKALKRISFNNENPICFIYFSRFLHTIKEGIVESGRSIFPNSKHVHFFTDAKNITEENLQLLRSCMDSIGVYDPSIADMFNLEFWPNSFPTLKVSTNDDILYDLCFVGNGFDRTEKIEKISEECIRKGLKIAIYLYNVNAKKRIDGIHYIDNMIPYKDVIEIVKKSRCVLELESKNKKNACSMRTIEAIVLNKKILTDNINIFNMPCCNENKDNISLFNDITQIDWKFLGNTNTVDYHYNGEYAAEKFLGRIEISLRA